MKKFELKHLLLLAAAAVVGFTGCKNVKDDIEPDPGKPTSVKIVFSELGAKPISTPKDQNASNSETVISKIDVFIYNTASLILETHKTLQLSDFTFQPGTGIWEANSPISTTTGQKNIYVGLNLPPNFVDAIKSSGPQAVQSINTVKEIIDIGSNGDNEGFAMFNNILQTFNLVEIPANNRVFVTVKRLVSKVAVQEGASLDANLNTLTTGKIERAMLSFNLRNVNRKMYALEFKDGGTIKDPNYTVLGAGEWKLSDFYQPFEIEYTPLTPVSETDNSLMVAKYMPENTSADKYQDELSFVSIKGTFVPATLKVYTNGTDASQGFSDNDNTGASATTFWRTIYSNGTTIYTAEKNIADDFITTLPGGTTILSQDEYNNGFCYWNVYINKVNGYNIYRNDFYRVRVNSIAGLGKPTPDTDPHEPIPTAADVSVDVEIIDWNLVDEDVDIPGARIEI